VEQNSIFLIKYEPIIEAIANNWLRDSTSPRAHFPASFITTRKLSFLQIPLRPWVKLNSLDGHDQPCHNYT
jgi:hypothetical protein